jgi:hypothetical protein
MRADAAVSELNQLHEDWDGDGALPIEAAAIRHARLLLADLRGEGFIPAPAVAPTLDGGVMLAWKLAIDSGARCLEIEAVFLGDRDALTIGYSDRAGLVYDGPIGDITRISGAVRDSLQERAA